MAKLLVSCGAIPSITDTSQQRLDAAVEAINQFASTNLKEVFASKRDVQVQRIMQGWLDDIVEKYGRIDGAVNIVEILPLSRNLLPSPTLMPDEAPVMAHSHLKQMMLSLQEFYHVLGEQKGSRLVHISYVSGAASQTGLENYNVAATSIFEMMRSALHDAHPRGICVNGIMPGILTDVLKPWQDVVHDQDVNHVCTTERANDWPQHIANLVLFLLSHDDSSMNGSVFTTKVG